VANDELAFIIMRVGLPVGIAEFEETRRHLSGHSG